jgi:deoxyadenosine/deoxycytidine kinase
MINENENIIVIVGAPATGKTHLSKELANKYPDYRIIHSDDYMSHGYQKSLYVMMDDIGLSENRRMIIEGVQTPRLLRKGVELGNFFPDLIIRADADDSVKLARYRDRGMDYPYAMAKNIETVYMQYRQMLATMTGATRHSPRIIEWRS